MNFSFLVRRGTGPVTWAPVGLRAVMMRSADLSTSWCSLALSLILILWLMVWWLFGLVKVFDDLVCDVFF